MATETDRADLARRAYSSYSHHLAETRGRNRNQLFFAIAGLTALFFSLGGAKVLGASAYPPALALAILLILLAKRRSQGLLQVIVIISAYVLTLALSESGEQRLYYTQFAILNAVAFFAGDTMPRNIIRSHMIVIARALIVVALFWTLASANVLLHPEVLGSVVSLPTFELYAYTLAGGCFGNPNNNAIIIFCTIILLFSSVTSIRRVDLAFVLMALAAVVITGSRYFIAASLMSAFLRIFNRRSFFLIAVAAVVIVIAGDFMVDFLSSRNAFLAAKLSQQGFSEFSDTLEARIFFAGEFLSFQWLPFGYDDLTRNVESWENPHSLLFESGFLFGIPGVAAFAAFAVRLFSTLSHKLGMIGVVESLLILFGLQVPSSVFSMPMFFFLVGAISAHSAGGCIPLPRAQQLETSRSLWANRH